MTFSIWRNSMRKHYLSLLSLLFQLSLIGTCRVKAQQASSSAVKGGRWSDPATWADKKVPAEGALVSINQGMDVVLDVSHAAAAWLTINGDKLCK
jgi:hypothetical protein